MLTGETSLLDNFGSFVHIFKAKASQIMNVINTSEADSAYFEEMRCEVKGRAGQEHNKCQPRTTAQCTASVGNTGVSAAPVSEVQTV